jgi:hypothetical protein
MRPGAAAAKASWGAAAVPSQVTAADPPAIFIQAVALIESVARMAIGAGRGMQHGTPQNVPTAAVVAGLAIGAFSREKIVGGMGRRTAKEQYGRAREEHGAHGDSPEEMWVGRGISAGMPSDRCSDR